MSYTQNPPNGKATIISHGLAASQDPTRPGQLDFFVIYQTDPMHRFTVVIPKREPTPEEIDTAIRADYSKQKLLINREVNL